MQAKAAPEYNHLSMAYSLCLNFSLTKQTTFCNMTNSFLMKLCLRKEHKHSIVIGHATSENLLQPFKALHSSGWWGGGTLLSVWNFCTCSQGIILQGNCWSSYKGSAAFSAYLKATTKDKTIAVCYEPYKSLCYTTLPYLLILNKHSLNEFGMPVITMYSMDT